MARAINRIWVQFGLWVAASLLITIALLSASMMAFDEMQFREFYRGLPPKVQQEFDALRAGGLAESMRAVLIYNGYWRGDVLYGEKWSFLIGLLICLPFGLMVSFWVCRRITLPLDSMVEAAKLVQQGNLAVRAHAGQGRGEMVEVVQHFNHMIDSLERLEQERRATAASLSHELRTPLTVLRARLHGICDDVIPATQSEFRGLLDQVEHLSRLVADLHMLSVADAGHLSLKSEPVNLALLVGDLLDEAAPRIESHGVAATLTTPDNTDPLWVQADPDRMRQIVSNLVDNVLRYAADGQWLEVALSTDGSNVILTVSDNGPGLPKSVRDNPFQRFSRPAGQAHKDGSGLGLSIVKTLVQLQGGEIRVEARLAGGTCMRISLPKAQRRQRPLSPQ